MKIWKSCGEKWGCDKGGPPGYPADKILKQHLMII